MMMNMNLKRNKIAIGWLFLTLLFLAPSVATAADLSISDLTQNEGDSGTTNFVFAVTLDTDASGPFNVDYATADDSATAGSDYVTNSGTLNFAGTAGETQTVTVAVTGEEIVELNETFFVNISSGSLPVDVNIADAQGVGTITNDDTTGAFSIDDVSLSEGDSGTTNFVFTVTLSHAVDTPVTVDYATADDSATAGSDYVTNSGTLNFAGTAGETQTVTVAVTGEEIVELNESFFVDLSNAQGSGRTLGISDAQGVGTITNDDTTGAFSIDDVSLSEGDSGTTNFVFTVTLSHAVDTPVTVDYATADDSATAGSDYVTNSGTLNFAGTAGETQTVTVAVTGEEIVELNESFFVDLSNAQGSGRTLGISDAQGVGTITNDDTTGAFSIDDVSLSEGDSGTTNFVFTVTLSHAVDTPVTVDYATADDSATAGSDYVTNSGTLNFAGTAGETQTVTVAVTGEEIVELNESFFVDLSNAQGSGRTLGISDAQGVGTITNDDTTGAFSIDDVSLSEGDSGTTNFVFTVTLSHAVDTPVTVDYATADDSATAGSDYVTNSGTLNFAGTAGETQTVTVAVTGEEIVELNESFFVDLSNAQGSGRTLGISDAQGVGTITNDDTTGAFSIDDVSLSEGDSGTTNFVFTVTLSHAVDTPVTVDYATADDSATAGSDYVTNSGTLNFAGTAGETQTVTVAVTGEEIVELNESFFVDLSNAQGSGRTLGISDAQGVGTITNDDTTGAFSIDDVSLSEGDSGTTNFVFTVTLSHAVDTPVTVDYATADDSATAGSDYVTNSGTLNFAGTAGETQTVTVAVTGEEIVELNESFFVDLSNAQGSGRTLGISDAQGVGTITNDDTTGAFSIDDVSLSEGDSGTTNFVFTVTLSHAVDTPVTVDYATADDSATAGSDYVTNSGTLNFAGTAGETQTVTVAVTGEEIVELNESFFVDLSNAQGSGRTLGISDAQGVGTITNDDSATLSLAGPATIQEGTTGTYTISLSHPIQAAVGSGDLTLEILA